MSPQNLNLLLHLLLAALYLPVLVTLFKRHAGQEAATLILGIYVGIALLLTLAEGMWRGGQLDIASTQVANDFQTYAALLLVFILVLGVISFTRRDITTWLGIVL